jgi:hypothetical protein
MEKGGFKQPKFCMIIVGTGSFLHIEDDVWIVPLEFLCL